MNDMEIEIAHEYEETLGTIEESETDQSDTDSILSKDTLPIHTVATIEAGSEVVIMRSLSDTRNYRLWNC